MIHRMYWASWVKWQYFWLYWTGTQYTTQLMEQSSWLRSFWQYHLTKHKLINTTKEKLILYLPEHKITSNHSLQFSGKYLYIVISILCMVIRQLPIFLMINYECILFLHFQKYSVLAHVCAHYIQIWSRELLLAWQTWRNHLLRWKHPYSVFCILSLIRSSNDQHMGPRACHNWDLLFHAFTKPLPCQLWGAGEHAENLRSSPAPLQWRTKNLILNRLML